MSGTVTLHHGDCLEVMRGMADASVDAVVTDPPYELNFMGRKWDGTGIAFRVETWAEALRVLKPGGTILDPFAGSGSTGLAAMAESFDCILVEREFEYCEIIKVRLAAAQKQPAPKPGIMEQAHLPASYG